MFDQYESLLSIITGDLYSKNSFMVNLKNLYANNYITFEDYNILKLFLKIRNILAHNNNVILYDISVVLGNNSLLFNAIITLVKDIQIRLTTRYRKILYYIFQIEINLLSMVIIYIILILLVLFFLIG